MTFLTYVHFQFAGVHDDDGTFPIHMTSLDTTKVQEEITKVLRAEPTRFDYEYNDACGDGGHGLACPALEDEHHAGLCILEQVSAGRCRQKKLDMLHLLTKCAQWPSEANGLGVLEGMATESCIYEVE